MRDIAFPSSPPSYHSTLSVFSGSSGWRGGKNSSRNAETGVCFKKMAPIYFVYNRGPSLELHVRFLRSFEDIPGLLSNVYLSLLK